MKREIALILVVVMAASVFLIGCGGDDGTSSGGSGGNSGSGNTGGTASESTTLSIWAMGDEGNSLKNFAANFTQETGIAVEVQVIPWANAHDKLLTAVASKKGPDVLQMGTTWMPEFVAAGALMDISTEMQASAEMKPDNFFPGTIQTVEYDGKYYGVPWVTDTRVLFYRTDILKSVGYDQAPQTWEELSDAALKLSKRSGSNMYGISWDANEQSLGFMFARQNGSELFTDNNKVPVFNQPPFVEAIQWMESFIQNGSAPKTDLGLDFSQTFGGDGMIPMFISGPWMVTSVKQTVTDITEEQWATSVLPKGKVNNESIVGGSDLTVFNWSTNKDNALKFIEYMSQPANQVEWYKTTGDIPSNMAAWDDPSLANDPFVKVFGEQLKTAQPMPLIVQFEPIAQAYLKSWEQIYAGGADVQKTMDDLNNQAVSILKQ